MKWWWLVGGVLFVVLMEVNVRVYGGSATFHVPIGWLISGLILVHFRRPNRKVWAGLVMVIVFTVGVFLSIPTYSVAQAEQDLLKTYEEVTYIESVPTTGDDWNLFNPRRGYRFKASSGESLLFIPDSGNVFEL